MVVNSGNKGERDRGALEGHLHDKILFIDNKYAEYHNVVAEIRISSSILKDVSFLGFLFS